MIHLAESTFTDRKQNNVQGLACFSDKPPASFVYFHNRPGEYFIAFTDTTGCSKTQTLVANTV